VGSPCARRGGSALFADLFLEWLHVAVNTLMVSIGSRLWPAYPAVVLAGAILVLAIVQLVLTVREGGRRWAKPSRGFATGT
jgi:hypothetical protein